MMTMMEYNTRRAVIRTDGPEKYLYLMRRVVETHSTRRRRRSSRSIYVAVVVARSRVHAHAFSKKLYRTAHITRHGLSTIYTYNNIWVSHVGSVGKRGISRRCSSRIF